LRDEDVIAQAREVATTMIAADATLQGFPELAAEVAEIRSAESATFIDKG